MVGEKKARLEVLLHFFVGLGFYTALLGIFHLSHYQNDADKW